MPHSEPSERKPTNLELMHFHVQALYIQDSHSKLLAVNDWCGGVVPRFFLGRTFQGNVWRFRHDLPGELCDELRSFCIEEPLVLSGPPVHEEEYKKILSQHDPINLTWSGPAYGFPMNFSESFTNSVSPPISSSTSPITSPVTSSIMSATMINQENAWLLERGLTDWLPDVPHQQPMAAVITDELTVAICSSVRITKSAHEAGVEVLDDYRKRGFACSVVSSWAQAVSEAGAIPMYSTSYENLASQKVAEKLGLFQYGTDFHIT